MLKFLPRKMADQPDEHSSVHIFIWIKKKEKKKLKKTSWHYEHDNEWLKVHIHFDSCLSICFKAYWVNTTSQTIVIVF